MSLLTVKKIYPDTYQIVAPGIGFGGVNMYLLIGSDKALLVDSGYGALPIMPVIREITSLGFKCHWVRIFGPPHRPRVCSHRRARL